METFFCKISMKRLQSVVRGWKYIKYKSQYTQFLFNTFPIVYW